MLHKNIMICIVIMYDALLQIHKNGEESILLHNVTKMTKKINSHLIGTFTVVKMIFHVKTAWQGIHSPSSYLIRKRVVGIRMQL